MNKLFMLFDTLLKKEIFKAAILIATCLIFVFHSVLFGGRTLMFSSVEIESSESVLSNVFESDIININLIDPYAFAWQFSPLYRLVEVFYKNRILPLWNPYSGAGTPLAADMQSSAFFLPLILWSSLSNWSSNLDYYFIFRLFIAGLFTFLLCRRLKLSFWSSNIASVLFMLNGYFIGYINQAHLNVEVLLPAVIWAVESYIQKRKILFLVAISGFVFLVITGGMPESSFLTILFCFGYTLVRIFLSKGIITMKQKIVTQSRVLFSILAGVGFSSFLIFPFLEYLKLSVNYHTPENQSGLWLLDNRLLGALFLPRILPHTQQMLIQWFYNGEFAQGSLSIIGFLLLLISLSQIRRWFAIRIYFVCSFILIFGKIFGIIGFNWIGKIPIFNLIVLTKFPIAQMSFAISLLAAFGWESLLYFSRKKYLWINMSLLFLLLIISGYSTFYRHYAEANIENSLMIVQHIINEVIFSFVIILSCYTLIIIRLKYGLEKRVRNLTSIFLISLIIVTVVHNTDGGWQIKNDLTTEPSILTYVERNVRLLSIDSLHPNITAPYKISNIRINNALYPSNYMGFLENLVISNPPIDLLTSNNDYDINSRALDYLALSYLVVPRTYQPVSTKFYKVYQDATYSLYKNRFVIPRYFIFHRATSEPLVNRTYNIMKDSSFDFQSEVVVNSYMETGVSKQKTDKEIRDKISVIYDTPLKIKLVAETGSEGILSLSDTYYPGWIAKVNGSKVDILLVNSFARGIILDQGISTIEFIYRPSSYVFGFIVSCLTIIIFIYYLYKIKEV